jgi:enamine deaminase RidA (YjgF/YER057c/UK114 family)
MAEGSDRWRSVGGGGSSRNADCPSTVWSSLAEWRHNDPGSLTPSGSPMSEISSKFDALGLALPAPARLPPGIVLPFSWIRVRGNRAYVSGHIALKPDGSIAEPLGKVGAEVSQEQGYDAARHTALAILGSLKRDLGDLDRITAWLRVFGMVNAAPGFDRFPLVINGFSDLIIQLFGAERGGHARSAVGMAGLPFGSPVEIEAEVEIQT